MLWLRRWILKFKHEYDLWLGEDIPFESVSPEVKWHQLIRYSDRFDYLVETGTALGVTTEVLANYFQKVWTIELSEDYFRGAKVRLDVLDNVKMLLGSSASVLVSVLRELNELGPAVFFLDGHYSGPGTGQDYTLDTPDTPVVQELSLLADSVLPNVVIIDDARIFKGEEWSDERFDQYPSRKTLEEIVSRFKVPSLLRRELDSFIVEPVGLKYKEDA